MAYWVRNWGCTGLGVGSGLGLALALALGLVLGLVLGLRLGLGLGRQRGGVLGWIELVSEVAYWVGDFDQDL